jgi:hypothetical protein
MKLRSNACSIWMYSWPNNGAFWFCPLYCGFLDHVKLNDSSYYTKLLCVTSLVCNQIMLHKGSYSLSGWIKLVILAKDLLSTHSKTKPSLKFKVLNKHILIPPLLIWNLKCWTQCWSTSSPQSLYPLVIIEISNAEHNVGVPPPLRACFHQCLFNSWWRINIYIYLVSSNLISLTTM